jgi:hypothetical protein
VLDEGAVGQHDAVDVPLEEAVDLLATELPVGDGDALHPAFAGRGVAHQEGHGAGQPRGVRGQVEQRVGAHHRAARFR